MTTVVVIDDIDLVRAGEAIGGDATPAKGETMCVKKRAGESPVAIVYASSIVDLASRRIDYALRTLLDRMRDLDDADRYAVIAVAADVIDESVAAIERSVAAIETYLLKEDSNGYNHYSDV
jgi:uncharacterized SAM-dependent methyltransferase